MVSMVGGEWLVPLRGKKTRIYFKGTSRRGRKLVPLGRNGEERNMLKEQAKIEQACSFKRIIKQ